MSIDPKFGIGLMDIVRRYQHEFDEALHEHSDEVKQVIREMKEEEWKQMDGTFRAADVPDDIYDAIKCVTSVFDVALASGKHKPGDWRFLSELELWDKFNIHKSELIWGVSIDNEDHLANLCCRALMLLQLREESKLKGPRG